jgi:hypothetical protein
LQTIKNATETTAVEFVFFLLFFCEFGFAFLSLCFIGNKSSSTSTSAIEIGVHYFCILFDHQWFQIVVLILANFTLNQHTLKRLLKFSVVSKCLLCEAALSLQSIQM